MFARCLCESAAISMSRPHSIWECCQDAFKSTVLDLADGTEPSNIRVPSQRQALPTQTPRGNIVALNPLLSCCSFDVVFHVFRSLRDDKVNHIIKTNLVHLVIRRTGPRIRRQCAEGCAHENGAAEDQEPACDPCAQSGGFLPQRPCPPEAGWIGGVRTGDAF